MLQAFAYRELHLRQAFNSKLKARLLAFAKGTDLDLLASNDYGLERLEGEDDEALVNRILRSLDGYSTAGSRESYEYHAYSVSALIDYVKAYSPSKGEVTVVIASKVNAIDEALRLQVEQALSADKVRPITDKVTVKVADVLDPQISATVYINNSDEQAVIEQRIIDNFASIQLGIGETLPLSQMIAYLHVTGVFKVELNHTMDIEYGIEQIIHITPDALNLSFGGING